MSEAPKSQRADDVGIGRVRTAATDAGLGAQLVGRGLGGDPLQDLRAHLVLRAADERLVVDASPGKDARVRRAHRNLDSAGLSQKVAKASLQRGIGRQRNEVEIEGVAGRRQFHEVGDELVLVPTVVVIGEQILDRLPFRVDLAADL